MHRARTPSPRPRAEEDDIPAEAPASQEPSEFIENRTYEEIAVGDQSVLTRTLRPEDIQLFAIMSGDVNPAHVDPEYEAFGGAGVEQPYQRLAEAREVLLVRDASPQIGRAHV